MDCPQKVRHFWGHFFMFKRPKYDYTFRLRCVESVILDGQSIHSVAFLHNADRSSLRLWVRQYQNGGATGLLPRAKQVYDLDFKLKVLQILAQESLSLRDACVRFSIPSPSIIIQWRKAYAKDGLSGLHPKRKGRKSTMKSPFKRKPRKSDKPMTREEELLKENEYLRAENELLKKLHALVQTRKKQEP
jgi:transposase